MGAMCGTESAYPAGAHEITLSFVGVHVAQSLVMTLTVYFRLVSLNVHVLSFAVRLLFSIIL